MKEHPILFSTSMVQAILEGRKTQTRRVVKEAKGWDYNWRVSKIKEEHKSGDTYYEMRCGTQYSTKIFKCPYGEVGDLLWVRETFLDAEDYACHPFHDEDSGVLSRYDYKADCPADQAKNFKWKPSIHMPKEASRIWLEITNIKVERLQDINEDDAIAEGAKHGNIAGFDVDIDGYIWNGAYKRAFKKLWQSINGEDSWGANPWVWAISFKRIKK